PQQVNGGRWEWQMKSQEVPSAPRSVILTGRTQPRLGGPDDGTDQECFGVAGGARPGGGGFSRGFGAGPQGGGGGPPGALHAQPAAAAPCRRRARRGGGASRLGPHDAGQSPVRPRAAVRPDAVGGNDDGSDQDRERPVSGAPAHAAAAGRARRVGRAARAGDRAGPLDAEPGGARQDRRRVRADARADRLGPQDADPAYLRTRAGVDFSGAVGQNEDIGPGARKGHHAGGVPMAHQSGRRKRRTREHVIADLSANHVEWYALLCGYSVERTFHDYGIDLWIATHDRDGEVENGRIRVQLKATDHLRTVADGQFATVRVSRKD